jgi:hypothetical protein
MKPRNWRTPHSSLDPADIQPQYVCPDCDHQFESMMKLCTHRCKKDPLNAENFKYKGGVEEEQ